jgi:hypothetical protein
MKQLNSGYKLLAPVYSQPRGIVPAGKTPGILRTLALCLIFSIILISGCKLESPNEVIIDNKMDIYYTNGRQEDLLNDSITGSFNADSIHLYNVVKGIKKEVSNRAEYPHNFFVYKNEASQKYVLRVFIEVDTTLLELNRYITDTINCSIERSVDIFIIRKVRYNGIVTWDDYAVGREFIITK